MEITFYDIDLNVFRYRVFFIETDKFHRSAHFDNGILVASKSILSICKITGSYFIGLFIIKCLNVSTRNR